MIDKVISWLVGIASLLGLGIMLGRRSKQGEVDDQARRAQTEKWKADEIRAQQHVDDRLNHRTDQDLIRTVGATGRVQRNKPES